MNFSVDPDIINPLLQVCSKISNPKGFKPIYGYTKIVVGSDNVLTLSVFDSYVQFTGRIEVASVREPGEAIVECDRLTNVFKTRIGGFNSEVKIDDNFLLIKQGEFRGKLPLYKKEEFPEFDFGIEIDYSIDLTPSLVSNLSRCSQAVDTKSKDNPFHGLLLDFESTKILHVCGFSNSLVYMHVMKVPEHGGFRCVMAPSCFPLLSSYNADVKTVLGFDLEKNRAVFSNPLMKFKVGFVEDKYPQGYVDMLGLQEMAAGNYYMNKVETVEGQRKIVSKTLRKFIQFKTSEFLGVLESAASVLGDEDNAVVLNRSEGTSDHGIAEFSGYNRLNGAKASEKMLVTDNLENSLTIGLHAERIRATVSKFRSESFKMFVHDALSPVVLVEDGSSDFCAISMPLRIS
jgi:DNA polymerase III sliding clamp (beta) subunit (PCNA family)